MASYQPAHPANATLNLGECQVCGRHQKIRNGKLAQHGQTKYRGGSTGTCQGSHHPAVATGDVSALAGAINHATIMRGHSARRLAELEAPEYVRDGSFNLEWAKRGCREAIKNQTDWIEYLERRMVEVKSRA